MTRNCDYDSVVGVISPVENEILPIVQLILKLTKYTHFLQNSSGCVFASGKNGRTPSLYQEFTRKRGLGETLNEDGNRLLNQNSNKSAVLLSPVTPYV